jgi:uncharacterized membrane protein
MEPFIRPDNAWVLWAAIVAGAAASIHLEQTYRWGARASGPVLALLGGMLLSNLKLLPTSAPTYDVVDDFLVPAAIPLLLFRANVKRIIRETGPMFRAFHVASAGTILGAFVAAFVFRGAFARVPEVTGIMTGSYIGGAVNFVAIKNSYGVPSELANPLLVADNFIMAGIFALLFAMGGSRFFRRLYPHPHSLEATEAGRQSAAAAHWRRKEIGLADIAKAMAIAVAVAAAGIKTAGVLKAQIDSKLLQSMVANPFVWITLLTVGLTTVFHRRTEAIQGAEELGMYLLYLFFFVIGLRADFWQVLLNVPVLFLFCLVMAGTNLAVTLAVGRLLRLNLEELLLSVNATLGGAPSAAAMAVACGWTKLVLPGLLAGIWGYVIGTFLGIAVAEALLRVL